MLLSRFVAVFFVYATVEWRKCTGKCFKVFIVCEAFVYLFELVVENCHEKYIELRSFCHDKLNNVIRGGSINVCSLWDIVIAVFWQFLVIAPQICQLNNCSILSIMLSFYELTNAPLSLTL